MKRILSYKLFEEQETPELTAQEKDGSLIQKLD
jgi:hypothetical protein